jgi:hypothetical protein
MPQDEKPVTKRVGPRRVRTEPAPGQTEEPVGEEPREENSEKETSTERLKRDKPPHY